MRSIVLSVPPLQYLAFLMNGQISEVTSRMLQPSLNAGQTVDEPPGFHVRGNLILEVLDVLAVGIHPSNA